MRKRSTELDVIFKKLYEDRVLGHLSVEQFQALSSGYAAEQEKLAAKIPAKESTKWSKKAMQTIEIHYSDIGCSGGDVPQDRERPRQEISA